MESKKQMHRQCQQGQGAWQEGGAGAGLCGAGGRKAKAQLELDVVRCSEEWMGEGRGGVGCVGFPFAVGALGLLWHCVLGGGGVCRWEEGWSRSSPCLRPSHPGNARSRLISEAKQGRAWLVLGWETSWEYRVL